MIKLSRREIPTRILSKKVVFMFFAVCVFFSFKVINSSILVFNERKAHANVVFLLTREGKFFLFTY